MRRRRVAGSQAAPAAKAGWRQPAYKYQVAERKIRYPAQLAGWRWKPANKCGLESGVRRAE